MIRTKRNITLTSEKRHELEVFTKAGERSVKLVKRAAIILALDTSGARKPDAETDIVHRIGVSSQTIQNVKKDFETAVDLNIFLQPYTRGSSKKCRIPFGVKKPLDLPGGRLLERFDSYFYAAYAGE